MLRFFVLAIVLAFAPGSLQLSVRQDATVLDASLGVSLNTQRDWAESCPYIPLAIYKPPPLRCKINQVNILARHGARFPTSTIGTIAKTGLAKIQNVTKFTDSRLNFIKSFVYDLGTNNLVPFGAKQCFDLGAESFQRYSSLFSASNIPFVRSDSSDRVVKSAMNWTAGFASASGGRFSPSLNVILSTSNNGNDTLEDGSCPNAGDGSTQTNAWAQTFLPTIQTILNNGAPGANLTITDVFGLMNLCPFETLFHQAKSPWCGLFESIPMAWDNFSYFGDLDKFYGVGYGEPLGPVQGVGWVNELLARLTNSPVVDHTQTNSTLDSNPATFPLNRSMYADFSHDDQITAIISAIGLFKQPGVEPLNPTKPNPQRIWRAAVIVPFGSRIVIERMDCTSGIGPHATSTPSVRILVNQEIQPLEFCHADSNGICTLDAFVASQSFARSGGNFEACFS